MEQPSLFDGCPFCGRDASDPDHWRRCDGRQGLLEDDISGMVHHDDPVTSLEAAVVIARHRTELHDKIEAALRALGPMDDEQLEQLPQFAGYGPSTIRKRRSELFQMGVVTPCGVRTNSRGRRMLVWTGTD